MAADLDVKGVSESMMLSQKYLTEDIRKALDGVQASCGFKLADVIRSGHENRDSNIGAYAGDADCYVKFSALFDPIIADYHSFSSDSIHRGSLAPLDPLTLPTLNQDNTQILSSRIRVARNIEGVAFPPAITSTARLELERRIVAALANLEGDFTGSYYSLADMSEKDQESLTQSHFLFKKGDRFLESAGVNRNWPAGRGIFYTKNRTFLVWVNEEDHLRIISMQQGGALATTYERLRQGIEYIGEQLPFAHSQRLGYLSSCPTNLGTAMRASVHIRLPHLGQRQDFRKLCDQLQLSVRGIHGEHSNSENGVWDISNKQRLGITEVECIEILYSGLEQLIRLEENG